MQPVSTEYPGLPRRPTRHLGPALRALGILCCLLMLASGCDQSSLNGERTGYEPASATEPPERAAFVALGAATAAGSLDIQPRADGLQVEWRFDPALDRRDARLLLELVVAGPPQRLVGELRPTLRGNAVSGGATLSVQAHHLPWQALALRARLSAPDGSLLAESSAVPLAPALAAGAQRIEAFDPVDMPAADSRYGAALAFSADGSALVVADPGNRALFLHQADDSTAKQGPERVRVAGFETAVPGSVELRAAARAAVVMVSWRDPDGASPLVILEADEQADEGAAGAGFREVARRRYRVEPWRAVQLAANGRQLDLVDESGQHVRWRHTAGGWQEESPTNANSGELSDDAIGFELGGDPVRLVDGANGPVLRHASGEEHALPATNLLTGATIRPATRLSIDPDGLHLAIATLQSISEQTPDSRDEPATGAVPTLHLFSRASADLDWQAGRTLRQPVVSSHARQTLHYGTRPSAESDVLLWHWADPQRDLDAPRGPDMQGLAVLTTRALLQAFGDADRTDRAAGQWRLGFSLPADANEGSAAPDAAPLAAALSADGTALLYTGTSAAGGAANPVIHID